MSQPINHWCWACGTGYYACDNCEKGTVLHWRSIACTAQCFQLLEVLNLYRTGKINVTEAQDALKHIGFNRRDIPKYKQCIQDELNSIFQTPPPQPKNISKKYNVKEVETETQPTVIEE
jgi:hypothetical protein